MNERSIDFSINLNLNEIQKLIVCLYEQRIKFKLFSKPVQLSRQSARLLTWWSGVRAPRWALFYSFFLRFSSISHCLFFPLIKTFISYLQPPLIHNSNIKNEEDSCFVQNLRFHTIVYFIVQYKYFYKHQKSMNEHIPFCKLELDVFMCPYSWICSLFLYS